MPCLRVDCKTSTSVRADSTKFGRTDRCVVQKIFETSDGARSSFQQNFTPFIAVASADTARSVELKGLALNTRILARSGAREFDEGAALNSN